MREKADFHDLPPSHTQTLSSSVLLYILTHKYTFNNMRDNIQIPQTSPAKRALTYLVHKIGAHFSLDTCPVTPFRLVELLRDAKYNDSPSRNAPLLLLLLLDVLLCCTALRNNWVVEVNRGGGGGGGGGGVLDHPQDLQALTALVASLLHSIGYRRAFTGSTREVLIALGFALHEAGALECADLLHNHRRAVRTKPGKKIKGKTKSGEKDQVFHTSKETTNHDRLPHNFIDPSISLRFYDLLNLRKTYFHHLDTLQFYNLYTTSPRSPSQTLSTARLYPFPSVLHLDAEALFRPSTTHPPLRPLLTSFSQPFSCVPFSLHDQTSFTSRPNGTPPRSAKSAHVDDSVDVDESVDVEDLCQFCLQVVGKLRRTQRSLLEEDQLRVTRANPTVPINEDVWLDAIEKEETKTHLWRWLQSVVLEAPTAPQVPHSRPCTSTLLPIPRDLDQMPDNWKELDRCLYHDGLSVRPRSIYGG